MNGPADKIGTTSGRGGKSPQFSEDDIDRKIEEFNRTISLNPKNADAYRDRGLLHGRKRDYVRALSDFDRSLFLNPKNARAYALRGLVWLRKGDKQKAIADFDKAIMLDPLNAEAYRAHKNRALGIDTAAGDPSSTNNKNARIERGFDLFLNPFVLLGLSANATAQLIKQAYEDAVEDGVASGDVLRRAQQTLLTPKLRVEAEIGGFLDVRPELANKIIAKLKAGGGGSDLSYLLGSLHALPRSNVLAHLGAQFPIGPEELLELLEAQSTISVGGVYDAIIEARQEAGGGKVDRDTIADALAQLEERQIKAVLNALISESGFAVTFSEFVKRVLAGGDAIQITKLGTYIRVYSNAAAPELSRRREEVVVACDALRKDPKNEVIINSIATTLRSWNEIGKPVGTEN